MSFGNFEMMEFKGDLERGVFQAYCDSLNKIGMMYVSCWMTLGCSESHV